MLNYEDVHKDNLDVAKISAGMRVTKNYLGPKIEYVLGAGLAEIQTGKKQLDTMDTTYFGASLSAHISPTGAGVEAKATIVGGQYSGEGISAVPNW